MKELGILILLSFTSCIAAKSYFTAEFEKFDIGAQDQRIHSRIKRQSETHDAIKILSLETITNIVARFSHTEMTTEIENNDTVSRDVVFQTQLPKIAFISNFSMIINDTEYVGVVKEKAVAEQEFQEAKDKGVSAGLVQTQQRETHWFKVSVNVEPSSTVVFKLSFQQLLRRKLGIYEQIIFADPGKKLQKFSVKVFITEPTGITFLDAIPPYTGTGNDSPQDHNFSITVRKSKTQAVISYHRSNFDPVNTGRRFIVRYDVEHPNIAGDVWKSNGYFVHFFAPTLKTLPKRVVFVVDTSGSMSGRKMFQTKAAMQTILTQLGENDIFNIVTFESSIEKWNKEMVANTEDTIAQAQYFIEGLYASGGTNLNGGIITAITLLDDTALGEEIFGTSTIIVLTDGNPTSGVTGFDQIQAAVRSANVNNYPIFTLGFGADVSHAFLRELALQNFGQTRRIYEDSDSTAQLEGFFAEVANPLLANLTITYTGNVEQVTDSSSPIYFDGTEVVVMGKYDRTDEGSLGATIMGNGGDGKFSRTVGATKWKDFRYPVPQGVSTDFDIFFKRMWAYLSISQLIKREIVEKSRTESQRLKSEILRLSLKYNFVTPLTAMIAMKPYGQGDEVTKITDEKPKDPRTTPSPQRKVKPTQSPGQLQNLGQVLLNVYGNPGRSGRMPPQAPPKTTQGQPSHSFQPGQSGHSQPQPTQPRQLGQRSQGGQSGQSYGIQFQSGSSSYSQGQQGVSYSSSFGPYPPHGQGQQSPYYQYGQPGPLSYTTTLPYPGIVTTSPPTRYNRLTTTTTTAAAYAPTVPAWKTFSYTTKTTTTPVPITTSYVSSSLNDVPTVFDELDLTCGYAKNISSKLIVSTPGEIYSPNQTCLWKIHNTDGKRRMRLIFITYDLEESPSCGLDRVVVYPDYSESSEPVRYETICGFAKERSHMVVASRNFYILFQSDGEVQGRGFKAVVRLF